LSCETLTSISAKTVLESTLYRLGVHPVLITEECMVPDFLL
jgi:hypothetical protein